MSVLEGQRAPARRRGLVADFHQAMLTSNIGATEVAHAAGFTYVKK